jgi:hypothetical protein
MGHITPSGARRGEKRMALSSESGGELDEDGFRAGAFFLVDDLRDGEAAASASVPGRAFTTDLSRVRRAAVADERADVSVRGARAVTNDHGDRVSPSIMKFNIKVAPLSRRRFLA